MADIKFIMAFVAFYFLLILGAILWGRYRSTGSIIPGMEEFMLAKRNLPMPVICLTYLGSLMSAFAVVGLPGAVYVNGIAAGVFVMFSNLLFIAVIIWYGKPLRKYAADHNLISPIECVSHAYNSKWLGVFMALLIIILLIPYLSLQLVGLGKLIEGVSGGDVGYVQGVGFVLCVVAIYMIFGGMRAVAYTDFIQTIAIFVGIYAALILFITYNWGDIASFFEQVAIEKPELLSLPGPNGFFTISMFFSMSVFFIGIIFQPHMLTRMIMAKDNKQINAMAITMFIASATIFIPAIIFGLGGNILFPDIESNQVSGQVFSQLSSISNIGMMVAILLFIGVLGASMSTADSLLLAIGQLITRDVANPLMKIDRKWQVIFAKSVMLVMLIFSFILGLSPPQIMIDLALYSAAGICAFIPTMVGMFWYRKSLVGAFVSSIACLLLLVFLAVNGIKFMGFHEGFVTLISSSLIYILICYFFKTKKQVRI